MCSVNSFLKLNTGITADMSSFSDGHQHFPSIDLLNNIIWISDRPQFVQPTILCSFHKLVRKSDR